MERTAILHRGTELYYLGLYPVVLTQDIEVPRFGNDERQSLMLPCTSAIAFGDEQAEQEYTQIFSVKELTFKQKQYGSTQQD